MSRIDDINEYFAYETRAGMMHERMELSVREKDGFKIREYTAIYKCLHEGEKKNGVCLDCGGEA